MTTVFSSCADSDELDNLKAYRDHLTDALQKPSHYRDELTLQHWALLNRLIIRFEVDLREAVKFEEEHKRTAA